MHRREARRSRRVEVAAANVSYDEFSGEGVATFSATQRGVSAVGAPCAFTTKVPSLAPAVWGGLALLLTLCGVPLAR